MYELSNLQQVVLGLKNYYDVHKKYPSTLSDLVNKDGSIEISKGGLVVLGNKANQEKFFGKMKYAPSSDSQHYLLSLTLQLTKNLHGFTEGGPYSPLTEVIYGVNCVDPYLYCVADEKTKTVGAPSKSEAVAVDTSNWKIYRDEKNGVEFKYPPDFTVEQNPLGGSAGDAFVYNFRYEFYPEYSSGGKTSKALTRYSNFSLLFHPNSVTAKSFGGAYVENITIGLVSYEKVQRDKNRREIFYFLRYPQSDKYIQIVYRPTIDTSDIGGLSAQPDYVSGVEVVRKNPKFLDYQSQIKVLNAILSSVKLF